MDVSRKHPMLKLAAMAGLAVAASVVNLASAATAPGARPASSTASAVPMLSNSLAGFYDVTDRVYLSTDGVGTNNSSATVQVEKRSAQSKVRKAFLLAASTGFSGYHITNSNVFLNGNPVGFDASTEIANSISSFNIRADVTSMVKPIVDAAAPGRVDFTVSETNTGAIDGEILAVVLDDPNEPQTSINLFYGAQNTAGDSFNILLGSPVDASNAGQSLSFALGISYGFQPSGQFSQIDVNGVRLTTSAGGQDDGQPANGALLTVGGLDDSPTNPANPLATDTQGCADATAPRCDDELYDLKAVLADGTTNIQVNTKNPSNDDNIFFASLVSKGTVAIVNEGILLTPDSQAKQVGQTATVTAFIQDDKGNPVSGRAVSFAATGPDAGSGSGTTDSGGAADFKVKCASAGTDSITASFVDSKGVTKTSNVATVICQAAPPPPPPTCDTAAECTCEGLQATIVGPKDGKALIMGTTKNDVIVARGKWNLIDARGGDDVICGSPGDDKIFGGSGNDHIHGGGGNDKVFAGSGDDTIDTGSGNDLIDGGSGDDTCKAGGGTNLKFSCEH